MGFVDAKDTDADSGNPLTAVRSNAYLGKPKISPDRACDLDFNTIVCIAPENQAKILTNIHFQPYRALKDVFCVSANGDLWYVFGKNIMTPVEQGGSLVL